MSCRRMREEAKVKATLDALKKMVKRNTVQVGRTSDGRYALLNWNDRDRDGMCDECALVQLKDDPDIERAKRMAIPVTDDQIRVGH